MSSAPYKYSLAAEVNSPPRHRRPRRSASPEQRAYDVRGGGQSSSRERPYPPRGGGSGGGNDRERDNGYAGRDRGKAREEGGFPGPGRERDDGYARRNAVKRERADDGYDERERQKERDGDRKRYEEGANDVPKSPPKPNFANSGLLAKETNTVQGVQLKYNEPPEARKPLKNWRLYVFKGKEQVDLIHIYRQSCYLIGREGAVTDIPIAHPSCSKQHAAIQYRQITEKNEYGDTSTSVKPFIIDLESTNGTHVNDQEIPKSRYYELRNTDVIKFGTSSREYVLLHEEA